MFALDSEHRAGRLHILVRMLDATHCQSTVDATVIAERIEDFTAHRAARISATSLPPGR